MRKRLIIYIPVLVVLLLLATLLIVNHFTTPKWKISLDQYLDFQQAAGKHSFRLVKATQATQPAQFSAAMSAESYRNNVVFSTNNTIGSQYTSEMYPLPYPPDEVWCVLLQNDSQQQVVYVALHKSQNNADWIVHIPSQPYSSPSLQNSLSQIGCIFTSSD
jgi:hypothetical protein